MTTRDAIKAVFLRVKATLGVRELMLELPHLDRSTVSKECVYMAQIGMLTAEMVNNRHHGQRYEFSASAALVTTSALRGFTMGPPLISAILGYAPDGLTNTDMRYSIVGFFGYRVSKALVQEWIDQLIAEQTVARMTGNEKFPRYQLGGRNSIPWQVLDAAIRGLWKPGAPRRLTSSASDTTRRQRLPAPA